MGILIDNPLTSVQLQLRGGWRNLLITTGTYALIVFGSMGLWAEVDPKHVAAAAEGWTVVLMLIQTGLVLLFSIVRVNTSVRQDITSGIMESHRLMPITGATACVGFVVGPSLQTVAIGAVNCVAGVVSSTVAGIDPARWIKSNVIMLVFVVFVCTCSMFVSFYRRALFNSMIILVVVACFSGGMLLYALPAMAILISPLAGDSIFDPRGKIELFNPGLQWAFAGQAIVAGIILAAASRKFRQPERPAFSISLSLILLAAWVVLNLVGFLKWLEVEPVFLRYNVGTDPNRNRVQFAGSVLTALLITLLPIAAAVRNDRDRIGVEDRRRPFDGSDANDPESRFCSDDMANDMIAARTSNPLRVRVTGGAATILACASLVCFLLVAPLGDKHHLDRQVIGGVAISIIANVVSLGALLSAYRSTPRKTAMLVLAFLLAAWFAPLFIDIVKHSVVLSPEDAYSVPWTITAFGPIGTVLSPWIPDMQTSAGLSCQVGTAVLLSLVALLAERTRRRMHLTPERESSLLAVSALPVPTSASPPLNGGS